MGEVTVEGVTFDPDNVHVLDALRILGSRNKARKRASTPIRTTGADGDESPLVITTSAAIYGAAAVRSACAELAAVSEGGRNAALNGTAYTLGRLVDPLGLDVADVRAQLEAACSAAGNGLTVDDGLAATRASIESGLGAGRAKPRRIRWQDPAAESTDSDPFGTGLADIEAAHIDALADTDARFAEMLDNERMRARVREQVADEMRRARAGVIDVPAPVALDDFLAVDYPETKWRVADLLPIGARVVLGAPAKAGKSHMVGNLVRCLVDGGSFLDRYAVEPVAGDVVLVDTELTERMLAEWFGEQGIEAKRRVRLVSLRGYAGTLDLRNDELRARWATSLQGAAFVILDCANPVLSSLSLDENSNTDVGAYLGAFDGLLVSLGGAEGLVVQHHGHNGERTRGASKWRDWPDAAWSIVRPTEDGADAHLAPRYFSAEGRDVQVGEQQLGLVGRRLSIVGGDRRKAKHDRVLGKVVDVVTAQPGIKASEIEARIDDENEHAVRKARRDAIRLGLVCERIGDRNNAKHYFPADGSDPFGTVPNPDASEAVRRFGGSVYGAEPTTDRNDLAHSTTNQAAPHVGAEPKGATPDGRPTH